MSSPLIGNGNMKNEALVSLKIFSNGEIELSGSIPPKDMLKSVSNVIEELRWRMFEDMIKTSQQAVQGIGGLDPAVVNDLNRKIRA